MMKSKKLIAILTVVALLVSLAAMALADDKIYTSETFKLPKDRIKIRAEEPEEVPAEEVPAEEGPAEEVPAEEVPAEEVPAEEVPAEVTPAEEVPAEEVPAEEVPAEEAPAEETHAEVTPAEEAPAEEAPAEEVPADETPAEEAAPAELPEGEELPADEQLPENEAAEEPAEEPAAEPVAERQVRIYTSRKAVVTEGDLIEMTSELIGFGDLDVTYQWQVDRGDGLGWVDIEGATRWKYSFIASRETIVYSWRLIVHVVE